MVREATFIMTPDARATVGPAALLSRGYSFRRSVQTWPHPVRTVKSVAAKQSRAQQLASAIRKNPEEPDLISRCIRYTQGYGAERCLDHNDGEIFRYLTGLLDQTQALAAYRDLFSHQNSQVRAEASLALAAGQRVPASIEDGLRALLHDRVWAVRSAAISGLSRRLSEKNTLALCAAAAFYPKLRKQILSVLAAAPAEVHLAVLDRFMRQQLAELHGAAGAAEIVVYLQKHLTASNIQALVQEARREHGFGYHTPARLGLLESGRVECWSALQQILGLRDFVAEQGWWGYVQVLGSTIVSSARRLFGALLAAPEDRGDEQALLLDLGRRPLHPRLLLPVYSRLVLSGGRGLRLVCRQLHNPGNSPQCRRQRLAAIWALRQSSRNEALGALQQAQNSDRREFDEFRSELRRAIATVLWKQEHEKVTKLG